MKLHKVAVGSIGGTVSMTAKAPHEGVRSTLTAQDLIHSIPNLSELAVIHAESLFQIPSSYLDFEKVLTCLAWAKKQVAAGAAGVVLTQGTDTLEESSFLCDLFWDAPEPLIFTGAMRPPQRASGDGPANILASIVTAKAHAGRDRGVQVVMNDTVHEAKWVRKTHAASVETFVSGTGPAGVVIEQRDVVYFKKPAARTTFPTPGTGSCNVFMWEHTLADEGEYLDWAVAHGAKGLVVAGFGAGHVSETVFNKLSLLVKKIPVIICSRTGGGSTAAATYGYDGAEITLQKIGAIMGQWLCPRKARLLLWAVLANGLPKEAVTEYLDAMVIR